MPALGKLSKQEGKVKWDSLMFVFGLQYSLPAENTLQTAVGTEKVYCLQMWAFGTIWFSTVGNRPFANLTPLVTFGNL